jgi:predicted esterase
MPRFFRRLAEGVFDVEDLKIRTHELADFIERARLAYAVSGKIIAVGYSNGANIAASLMLLHPGVLTGAVLFRAVVPLVPDALVELKQTEVLLAAGRRDPIASPDQTARLRQMLERAGRRCRFIGMKVGMSSARMISMLRGAGCKNELDKLVLALT